MGLDTKTAWPTDRRSYHNLDFGANSQLRAAETGSWGRGQFGNPEEGERPPLEAATKHRSEDRDWEH
jgi:hypothetical protein